MAYDGFQHGLNPYGQPDNNSTSPINPQETYPPPSSYDTPYPYQPASDHLNMPQPQAPSQPPSHSAPPQGYYPEPPREQTSWPPPPPPPNHQTGRINDAVTSAVGNSAPSSYVSPDLVAQITANVIQQLNAANLNSPVAQQAPQPPQQQWAPPQPYQDHSVPHTPIISQSSPSPASFQQPPPPSEYPAPPHLNARLSPTPPERRESPSQYSETSRGGSSRPIPQRNDTFPTTLEKIWGNLFDGDKPTERLGQFLRGIATHLIENYPPGNTLVVVPDKLQKYYADTNIPSDPYPWQDIFDDRTSSISRLFREIKAEHHLVQIKLDERPDIPGLTPRGFEVLTTLMIQAHPEKEYERLQKAVLNMPISNPDNRKERFPKELPRRLFPEMPSLRLREELDQYIMKHCGVDLPPITDEEIQKVASQRHKSSTSPAVSIEENRNSSNDREKKTYQPPSAAVVDDSDEEKSPPAIERKRKPYTAQVGGGKVYDGANHGSHHRHANSFSTSAGAEKVRPRFGDESPPYRPGSRGPGGRSRRGTSRARSQSHGYHPGHDYRHSETDIGGGLRHTGTSSSGDYYYNNPPSSTNASELLEKYRELDRDDDRLYDKIREREKEREKSKYHDLSTRSTWSGDEDYYRGMLGGQGGGPSGYDYKSHR
ncbi:uncharacterized protein BDV14DRAFT_186223 [Aspergillus stella-maris]|uniref:uncharacterized protein n=1 Tax=Aspergillus stella-maris TaxID=1810926 RepID=UPI003CCD7E39